MGYFQSRNWLQISTSTNSNTSKQHLLSPNDLNFTLFEKTLWKKKKRWVRNGLHMPELVKSWNCSKYSFVVLCAYKSRDRCRDFIFSWDLIL